MIFLQVLFILALLLLAIILLFNLLTFPFYLYAMLRGAFYAPTPATKVVAMIELARKRKIQRMLDLGSGDGRIVAAFAQEGVSAEGWEINPLLVLRSRWLLLRLRLQHKAQIKLRDFWHASFAPYDLVTVYGIPHIMPKLERKLETELKPGSLIISNHFRFPHWKVAAQIGDIILYEKN